MVRAGLNVNHVTNFGWSALRWACHYQNAVAAKTLLRCGARVNEKWEGYDDENVDACRVRAQVIESMGGPEGVLKAHAEWLSTMPGRRTKAKR